jgi:GT2 family glycosyltransferase
VAQQVKLNIYDNNLTNKLCFDKLLKMIREADLSIVILSYNDQEILAECLDSASRNSRGLRLETIVINNGYPPLPSNLKERFPDIIWRENNKNLGFARAVNQGIKLSRAKYILCLNSDTTLLAESLSPLVRFMNEHNEAGAAGGKNIKS